MEIQKVDASFIPESLWSKVPAGIRAIAEPLVKNALAKFKPIVTRFDDANAVKGVTDFAALVANTPGTLQKMTMDFDGKPFVVLGFLPK